MKMKDRFRIKTVIENGFPHYKIEDLKTGKEVHCEFDELTETLYEVIGE